MKDGSYWKHMEQYVRDTQMRNGGYGNEDKADIIQNKLKEILTHDAFFIMVYDHCDGRNSHAFDYDSNQAVVSLNKGPSRAEQCNVIVYRSLHWHLASDEEKKRLNDEGTSFKSQKIPFSDDYEQFLKHTNGSAIHETKLLAMALKNRNIANRRVNCEKKPGFYTTVTDTKNNVFKFFAGFR
uniref:Phage protein n=1 Tax=Caenorhabditis tropicalis TaxID=1561998 RepID=A0A1I7ULJ0_9PELO